jgi:metallo-beta-lactamase family protein
MKITFLGAADTVTGSRHLVETNGKKILLDCGMFQGYKVLRERNWLPFAIAPSEIDAVVLSHAHLDHSGWLPSLVQQGFKGPIFATKATRDLAEILLLDSAHLQVEDAKRANRGGWSKHATALPLYDVMQAKRAILRFSIIPENQTISVGKVEITLIPGGHLLGASIVRLCTPNATLVFSGDLGRSDDLLMPGPLQVDHADILLVESTYGNRTHPKDSEIAGFAEIIRRTTRSGGTVLLPSFAVGRAQALLLVIQRLKQAEEIPKNIPIFLDSPMATLATSVYLKHRKLLRISAVEAKTLLDGVTLVGKPKDSERLSKSAWPKILISASGMATGGRVLHHLKALAPNPRNHIVFAGFQVSGTRGANMVAGATEVKIHGTYVAIKAKVTQFSGLSGHADANGLMAWLGGFETPPKRTFVVHGEAAAADTFRLRVKDELGWVVQTVEQAQTIEI